MAKLRDNPVIIGASVTLLISLAALLLVQLRENANAGQGSFLWESSFGDFLILFVLWLAVLASLALIAVTLFGRGSRSGGSRRTAGGSRPDPARQYRLAVEMAWVDRELSEAERDRLGTLERELDLRGDRADEIEREIMDHVKEEIEPPEPRVVYKDRVADPAERYRAAVEMAWVDEKLNEEEKGSLSALENELGLSRDQAANIERGVMGKTAEEIPTYEEREGPTPRDWMELVEECVELVDELDRHMTGFDPPRQELADHVILRMEEVLERSGVEVISDDETLDSRRHKPEKASVQVAPGAAIAETLSPGFAVGRRVLRRARVRVE